MIIVIDISYIQKKRAGYGHHSTELLRILSEHDFQNHYKLFGWSFSIDEDAIYSLVNKNFQIKVAKIPGLIKRFYFNKLKFPDIKFFVGDYDIYHSTEPLLPPIKDKKSIITIHDLAYKKFPNFFQSNVLSWDNVIKINAEKADAIIVPSNATKRDLIDLFGIPENKIDVVYLPINKKYFLEIDEYKFEQVRQKYKLKFPFALFVGTIEPRKNIKLLVRAFEEFHKLKKSNLNLVLVGKRGWFYQDILKSIDNSKYNDKIHMLNYVQLDDLIVLYRLAKFFIYPSLYEGYGVPVIEAMASGIPVIVSASSSLIEIAKDVGLFFDPTDAEQLTEAMLKLDEDSELRAELSKKGLEKIKIFNEKCAAEIILGVYKKLSRF